MFHTHLRNLETEGFLEEAWKDYYEEKHDIEDETCSNDSISSTKENSETLNITNLGGVFLCHGILLSAAFVIYFIETSVRKKNGTINRNTLAMSQSPFKFGGDDDFMTQRMDELSEKQDEMSENISKQIAALTKIVEVSMKGSESFHDNPKLSKSMPVYSRKSSNRDDLALFFPGLIKI